MLLYLHYNDLEKTSYQNGNRQRFISGLIKNYDNTQLTFPRSTQDSTSKQNPEKLSRLIVKDFRGFQSQQEFDFGTRFTFIYGRNGTGKSSLVDAIEYSLLNNIQEAKYKRIEVEEYIRNIYTSKSDQPQLYGLNKAGTEVKVTADAEAYNFAIVERNRIDNFARISAETNSVQQQRLAALVGLDNWNIFVNNFSRNLDTYLPHKDELNEQINAQNAELKKYKGQLLVSKKSIGDSDKSLNTLIQCFNQPNVDGLETYLNDQKQLLKEKLAKTGDVVKISDKLVSELENDQKKCIESQLKYCQHQSTLSQYKNNISLVELAKAVLDQRSINENHCPACLTQIKNKQGKLLVKVDPYEHATETQKNFNDATQLEKKVNEEKSDLQGQLRALTISIQRDYEKLTVAGLIDEAIPLSNTQQAIEAFFNQGQPISDKNWITDEDFSTLRTSILEHNKQKNQKQEEKNTIQSQLDKISKDEGVFETAKVAVDNAKRFQQEMQTKIKKTQHSLTSLKKKSVKAQTENRLIQEYSEAYDQVVKKIKHYTESLPISELEGLNKSTLQIYNLINKYDFTSEQIKDFQLPLSPNMAILIQFNVPNAPLINALDVLSEGHIRTLGLAILLAKALKNSQSFIVFDDVVNAIDDDHRKAIAEIITDTNGLFSNTQWIVTTHGQEFAKQLISNTSQSLRKTIREITFKEKDLGSDIRSIEQTQNYLVMAKKKLDNQDVRGCLADCRREIEVIMIKLWKVYSKRFHLRISIQVDPSNPIPETRNVMDVLRSSFKKQLKGNQAELEVMHTIFQKLDCLLDDQGISWFLVNKGTHEEENAEQHDPVEASLILKDLLIPLDEELTTSVQVKGSVLLRKNP